MESSIILASGSDIRRRLLEQAGVLFTVEPVRVDEDTIRQSMEASGAYPRDIADALAEAKAKRGTSRHPAALVIGCDQVLDFEGAIFAKPKTPEEVRVHLDALNGSKHNLYSAAVIYQAGQPLWRHVAKATLSMRQMSNAYLDAYVSRNWESIRHSVGGYKLEEEGVRLFYRIDGDHFCVLGMPLQEILNYLSDREAIPA